MTSIKRRGLILGATALAVAPQVTLANTDNLMIWTRPNHDVYNRDFNLWTPKDELAIDEMVRRGLFTEDEARWLRQNGPVSGTRQRVKIEQGMYFWAMHFGGVTTPEVKVRDVVVDLTADGWHNAPNDMWVWFLPQSLAKKQSTPAIQRAGLPAGGTKTYFKPHCANGSRGSYGNGSFECIPIIPANAPRI